MGGVVKRSWKLEISRFGAQSREKKGWDRAWKNYERLEGEGGAAKKENCLFHSHSRGKMKRDTGKKGREAPRTAVSDESTGGGGSG